MDDARYTELLNAILDLRNATELGFDNVSGGFGDVYRRFDEIYRRFDEIYRRFDKVYLRFDEVDRRFDKMEERWDRRFSALETRVEEGFCGVTSSLDDIRHRLTNVEQR